MTTTSPALAVSQSTGRASGTSPHHGARGWVARHPVTAFLAIAFGIAYPVMALPALANHGVLAYLAEADSVRATVRGIR